MRGFRRKKLIERDHSVFFFFFGWWTMDGRIVIALSGDESDDEHLYSAVRWRINRDYLKT